MLSMYDVSVPVFVRAFGNLSLILKKGLAHAEAEKLDPKKLVDARLRDDMLPLSGQVQRASDSAKGCAARLAGIEAPGFPDEEKTFAELESRIQKTVQFLKSVRPEQFEGSEQKDITLNAGKRTLEFKGRNYLLNFALPNFFFHATTAYDILRHEGVLIGKTDFLGEF